MGEDGREEVEIILKRIGPGRPSRIRVPTPLRVEELKGLVSAESGLNVGDLKLILKGQVICDRGILGEDIIIKLKEGDSLIVAVIPKPPAKYLRDGLDDDDDEDLKFRIPEGMSLWKKRILVFLQKKLKFPDFILTVMLSISLKAWFGIVLWFVLAPIANRLDMGPVFILGTGFALILLNLGRKQDGDVSAYSVFNEGFRELPGTLNADRLDRDIRAGQF